MSNSSFEAIINETVRYNSETKLYLIMGLISFRAKNNIEMYFLFMINIEKKKTIMNNIDQKLTHKFET